MIDNNGLKEIKLHKEISDMEQSFKPEEIKMDAPVALIKLFILVSVSLSLLNIITFTAVTAETSKNLISEVCSKTRNPNLCSQILRSNGRARKASSPLELGEVSINLSKSSAQSTKNTITMLRLCTRNREMKQRLRSCVGSYESAIIHYWKGSDYAQVGRYTAAALNEPIYCRHNFARTAPADVREGNNKLESLCGIVLTISNWLSGRNFSFLEGGHTLRQESHKGTKGGKQLIEAAN